MGMSRSTYYFEIGKTDVVEERNAKLTKEIEEIFFKNNGDYGVRRVYQELLNQKYHVNHKRVQRIMHKLGLHGKYTAKKYHSYKGEIGKAADTPKSKHGCVSVPIRMGEMLLLPNFGYV